MPRPILPSYRLHKATGQAVVVHKGKSHYLGKYGTPASRAAYDRVIADILARRNAPDANKSPADASPAPASPLLVSELILRYWTFATGYYVKNGRPTGELHPLRQALRLLRRHCGGLPVAAVGPLAIKEMQEAMVRQPVTRRVKVTGADGKPTFETKVVRVGLSRRTINKQVGRVKRVFRWAVAEQLLDAGVYAAVREARGSRSTARRPGRSRGSAPSPGNTSRRR